MGGHRRATARRALAAALLVLVASAAAGGGILGVRDFRAMRGDSPARAAPGFDDSRWPVVPLERLSDDPGILWLRSRVAIPADAGRPLAIFFAALASHEIYWDGELVGRGGAVGETAAREVPGPIETIDAVPDRLATPGEHVLAIRASAWHRGFRPAVGYWTVAIGPYPALDRAARGQTTGAIASVSGILLAAAFAFVTWLIDRRERTFLLLAGVAAVSAGLLFAELYRPLFGYPYDRHLPRLIAVTSLSWLLDASLALYLACRFPMRGRRAFLAIAVVGATAPLVAIRYFDGKVLAGYLVVFSAALVWTAAAARRGLLGSGFAAAGTAAALAALLVEPRAFLDRNLFLSLDALLASLIASRALQYRAERRQREAAEVRSLRLELELLKKRLQPHFLMNTLTALSEWIEEDPAAASRMVQALSEELRILGRIADRPEIPVAEEIALCRSHLEIMSLRKGARLTLETVGVEPEETIPPAVLHTLVENAITHGAGAAGDAVLRLRRSAEAGSVRFVFEAPLASGAGPPDPHEGTGLRYVRARLAETYRRGWTLRSGAAGGFWRTEIVLPAAT